MFHPATQSDLVWRPGCPGAWCLAEGLLCLLLLFSLLAAPFSTLSLAAPRLESEARKSEAKIYIATANERNRVHILLLAAHVGIQKKNVQCQKRICGICRKMRII